MVAFENDSPTDEHLLTQLAASDPKAFEIIYHRYAQSLMGYAFKRIRDKQQCEEIIQEIFISLWERREKLGHVTALKPYLYNALKYRIVNHIAHSVIRVKYAQHYEAFAARYENATEDQVNLSDFHQTLERTLSTLPDNCQKVFRLSRIQQLTIPEIANKMQLNPRTVENYITQALKHLRTNWKH